MAGDWIKMRGNLWDDPRVTRLVDIVSATEAAVIGALYWLWATADQHSQDGVMPGLSLRAVDRKTGLAGIGDALVTIGWVADHPEGIRLCRFEEHNGESAKRRCVDAQRKANVRKTPDKNQTDNGHDADELRRISELEKEKRREEKEIKSKAKVSAAPKTPKPSKVPLPADFCISDAVMAWAEKNGHTNLRAHFDSFVGKARANGYTYVDWDQALQNAVRDDWAKLGQQQARASPAQGQSQKFHFAEVDRAGDKTAMEASMRRHNIAIPDGDEEIEI